MDFNKGQATETTCLARKKSELPAYRLWGKGIFYNSSSQPGTMKTKCVHFACKPTQTYSHTHMHTCFANTYYVCRSRVVSAAEVWTVDGSVEGRISRRVILFTLFFLPVTAEKHWLCHQNVFCRRAASVCGWQNAVCISGCVYFQLCKYSSHFSSSHL